MNARTVGIGAGHAWDQLELAFYARGGLLLSLCGAGPVVHPRHIVAIHDAAVFAIAQNFSRPYRAFYWALTPLLARTTRAMVTVSEFSRNELAQYFPTTARKLRVVWNGAEHIHAERADAAVLSTNGLAPSRYVLALGSLSRNKNVGLVTRAFAAMDDLDLRLAVAGAGSSRVFSGSAVQHGPRIGALGYVSDAAIRALYENALCFVFPSFYEGFGIPPLEAMQCGCPVIVSDIPALRETCGDAALYCDPHDPRSLEAQIRALAERPELRDRLRELGLARARRFTWDRSAEMLLDVVREVRDGGVERADGGTYLPQSGLGKGTQ
ncbi:MAG: glycosyltransferase family 4 protein [Rhodospirillales bacterium]|nr:glycosyltransferase family 4 protein [Rhodospirillales bacterium]